MITIKKISAYLRKWDSSAVSYTHLDVYKRQGVGKTTTSINLAACLAEKKKKVLAIDVDPQGNMTSGLGVNKDEVENTVYNLMLDECSIAESIENTVVDNLYAVSYTHLLSPALMQQ